MRIKSRGLRLALCSSRLALPPRRSSRRSITSDGASSDPASSSRRRCRFKRPSRRTERGPVIIEGKNVQLSTDSRREKLRRPAAPRLGELCRKASGCHRHQQRYRHVYRQRCDERDPDYFYLAVGETP